ncbi:MAG: HAMP domain-containing histidine kinase [Paenibacillaceae bacterium]|nr:HAMP domain-containing histidine kinase [Paenibacillaceae bacterium]
MVKTSLSFRTTMILLFGLSMLVSGTITYTIYKALQSYYRTTSREDPLTRYRVMIKLFGDVNFFMLIFLPLSVYFFYLLTKRYAQYFREISNGIHHLASGNFHNRVNIQSDDEFGTIAHDMNLASEKLRLALERGDFAENSKEQLMLNLAHDLRTPLTSVLGYLDYLLQNEGLSDEQRKHFTEIAFTKARRLEKLIDELFEFARVNYGNVEVERMPLDLSELLAQLVEEMYPGFEKSNLEARMKLAPHLTVIGDGDMLARVFENLLTNACRYGADGRYVDIAGHTEEGEAVVQVINYGDPIAGDQLQNVFEMFYRGDKARTQKEGGTGLGLYIAKNIVEQHQGTISAQSDPVRTLFEVRLPLVKKDVPVHF